MFVICSAFRLNLPNLTAAIGRMSEARARGVKLDKSAILAVLRVAKRGEAPDARRRGVCSTLDLAAPCFGQEARPQPDQRELT